MWFCGISRSASSKTKHKLTFLQFLVEINKTALKIFFSDKTVVIPVSHIFSDWYLVYHNTLNSTGITAVVVIQDFTA